MQKNRSVQVSTFLSHEVIERQIYLVRGKKVMLDRDLANLYGVTTGNLNKAVQRNLNRFPEDFSFQLNPKEFKSLLFQIGRPKRGGTQIKPRVFTDYGILMLSSVLRSQRAAEVNIQIMRTFIRLKEILLTHKNIQKKLEAMEKLYDKKFLVVFNAVKVLLEKAKKDGSTRRFDL